MRLDKADIAAMIGLLLVAGGSLVMLHTGSSTTPAPALESVWSQISDGDDSEAVYILHDSMTASQFPLYEKRLQSLHLHPDALTRAAAVFVLAQWGGDYSMFADDPAPGVRNTVARWRDDADLPLQFDKGD